jgi:hypothetical protein
MLRVVLRRRAGLFLGLGGFLVFLAADGDGPGLGVNARYRSRAAGFESDPAVVGAILQAIVANHWKFMR